MQDMSLRVLERKLKDLRSLQERLLASVQDYLTVVNIQERSMVAMVNQLVSMFNKEVDELASQVDALKRTASQPEGSTEPGKEQN